MERSGFRAARHRDEGSPDGADRFRRMLPVRIEDCKTDCGAARSHAADPSPPCMVRNPKFSPSCCGNKANGLPIDRLDPFKGLSPPVRC